MKKVGALRFHVENSVLYFQEKNSHTGIVGPSEAHVTTLRVNLRDGSIGTFLEAPFPGNSSVVLGIIGLLNLHGGSVIVLVSKAKQVCSLPHAVFKVTGTQLVTHENVKTSFRDVRFASLLQEALDVRTYGQHMYFSYTQDLTLSKQARSDNSALSGGAARLQWGLDQRFVFNRGILKPLIDAGAEAFALPLLVGYVGQVLNPIFSSALPSGPRAEPKRYESVQHSSSNLDVIALLRAEADDGDNADMDTVSQGDDAIVLSEGGVAERLAERLQPSSLGAGDFRGYITLIARMASTRSGTRLWRKGLDQQGNNAHYVEVEQILSVELPDGTLHHHMHVHTRGSVPLLWSQPPDVFPSPSVRVVKDRDAQSVAFGKFANEMLQRHQAVTFLHIPSYHRGEKTLQLFMRSILEEHCHRLSKSRSSQHLRSESDSSPIALVFAGEGVQGLTGWCGMDLVSREARIRLVWGQVEAAIKRYGYSSTTTQRDAQQSAQTDRSQQLGRLHVTEHRARPILTSTAATGNDPPSLLSCRQSGVLHLSCWDAVDESLPLQYMVGAAVLRDQLVQEGLLRDDERLDRVYPEVIHALRILYSHMGNITADQVSGLGSLAGPSIKTGGNLPLWAYIGNAYFLVERWFHGTFLDARKQDAIDLVTGSFQVTEAGPCLASKKHSYGVLEMGALLSGWGLLQVYCALRYQWLDPAYLLTSVLLPFLVGFSLLGYVVRRGSAYVEQPELCKHLLAPGDGPPISINPIIEER